MVKATIADEMKKSGRGSIVYDAWSMGGIHYIGLYACYVKKILEYKNGEILEKDKTVINLISCAPMLNAMDEDADDEEEQKIACKFNAEIHAEHLHTVLTDIFNIDVEKWTMCCIADNTSTNHKIARLLKLPHLGCLNHLLNLDVQDWIKDDNILNGIVSNIGELMKEAKTLKNSAKLAEFTHLKPVLDNKTRWSGVRMMLERFLRIRQELMSVADDEATTLTVDHGIVFFNRCKRYLSYMEQIDSVTKFLQNRVQPFEQARLAIENLIEKVAIDRNNCNNKFFRCTFRPGRIQLHEIDNDQHKRLHPNSDFEKGVLKIQRGETNDLTNDKKNSMQSFVN